MITQETAKLQRIILNKHLPTYWVIFLTYQGNLSGADWDIFANAI